MVTPAPQWGAFQKPQQKIQKEEEKEYKEELPGKKIDELKPEGQKPQWGNFQTPETYQGEPDPTAEESYVGYFARNFAQNLSRLEEQIAGAPGNIEKLIKFGIKKIPPAAGLLGWGISQLIGKEKFQNLIEKIPQLPTSEELKEKTAKATGGLSEPKTEGERKFQRFTEDVGATLFSTKMPTKWNNLIIPAAANVVQNSIEGLGFKEDTSTIGKMATWFALSFLKNVNANTYAAQLTNQGRNGIPQNLQADIPRLQRRLQNVANDPHLLHADPRTSLARQELASIEKDISNGQTSVRSLMTAYDGVNAAKRNRGLFELNSNDQKFAKRAIDRVNSALRDEILESGAAHPEALQNWQNGIKAWSVIHQSRGIMNWISSLLSRPEGKAIGTGALGLFGITAAKTALLKTPIAPATLVGTPIAYKTGEVLYRVWNDPNLRKYYWNAIQAAQKENIPVFISNYNKLNKSLEKEEKKNIKK